MKLLARFLCAFVFIMFCIGISDAAETITLTTYYPAPYGEYEELRANKFAVGSTATMPTTDGEFTCMGAATLATDSGNVGIGTTSPGERLTVGDGTVAIQRIEIDALTQSHLQLSEAGTEKWSISHNDVASGSFGIYDFDATGGNGYRLAIDNSGNVGIGIDAPTATLHVDGNIKIETVGNRSLGGTIKNLNWSDTDKDVGRNNDLAELFDASEDVEVGEVLVIDKKESLKLRKSGTPYEKGIAGVVSGSPAIVFEGSQLQLGPPEDFTKGTKPPVALAGRVPCKVSIENGPIERGDLLTSSSTPGHAMKATDREKSFGTILGKALQPFNGGPKGEKTGEIVVLVTLQ